jgi:hypothetical protein
MTSVHIRLKMAVLYSAKNFFIRIIFQGEYFYRILPWFMEISAILCTGSELTVWELYTLASRSLKHCQRKVACSYKKIQNLFCKWYYILSELMLNMFLHK